jgi:hypothetical protein
VGSRPGPPGRSAASSALAPGDAPGTLDFEQAGSWSRRHIRGGIGRALLALAVDKARRRGGDRLTIRADPNATRFDERNGGVRIGESPSDAGARPPAPAGVTLTSGLTGSADPNVNRRSGGSASLQIPYG